MARQRSWKPEIKEANNSSKIHVFTKAGGNGFSVFSAHSANQQRKFPSEEWGERMK